MVGKNEMWDRSINLKAYMDVESMSNYATVEDLEKYRKLLLSKSEPAVKFIRNVIYKGIPLKVLEFCSGSSRMLYALEKEGLLEDGYGVEISPSRHEFAQKWKDALGSRWVHNIHCSAEDYTFPDSKIDLIIMIDGALSYIYPCDPELPREILKQSCKHLTKGGAILLESDVLSEDQLSLMKRDGRTRIWNWGDEKDPFKYALYQTEPVSWEQEVFKNTSIYLSQNTFEEKIKEELYKFYSADELTNIMDEIGLSVRHYASFSLDPYDSTAKSLVTLAVKN